MGCKLCLKQKKLQKSHIIPEFFYQPLYDNLHKFNVITTSSKEKNKPEQKGIRERLLCYDCEQLLSPNEDYVRRVIYGGTEIKISRDGNNVIIWNTDYIKFKLFQLSLLWRSSVSKLKYFSNISLGPHEEKIRQMLITENPGESYDYGCFLSIPLMKGNVVIDDLILSPESLRINGHNCYRFVLGGCFWIFVVSTHSKSFEYSKLFLNKNGKLIIGLFPEEQTEFFTKLAQDLKRKRKL